MINITEKLKDCPQGTKLYSPLFGEVELVRIDMENPRFPIIVKVLNDESPFSNVTFTAEGKWYSFKQSECLLFPSKDNKDWNKFRIPVKKGDIMMIPNSYHAFITTGEFTDNGSVMFICGVDEDNEFIINPGNAGWTKSFYIPASEKAKKRLFDKMEAAGYRWNVDTLELEKIESKFKEGDVIIDDQGNLCLVSKIRDDGFITITAALYRNKILNVYTSNTVTRPIQLVSIASITDRNTLYSTLVREGYKYDKEQHKLMKQEFKPFDKVLVRDDIDEKWILSIFGCYEDEVDADFPYVCLNGRYCYCIPYEGNEHLLNTTKSPKDN